MSVLNLDGQTALITGGTRGIGWATARLFAGHGANVVITARHSKEAINQARILTQDFGVNALGLASDVENTDQVSILYRKIFTTYKKLDILINNAGVMEPARIGMIDDETVQRQVNTNLIGSINNLQAAARLMQRNKSGSIINVTSMVGQRGAAGNAVYAATKSAIHGLTFSAARELGPSKIRVNAVAPGLIDTSLIERVSEDIRNEMIDATPLGRIGYVDDVANVILFLASDLARFVSGQVIGVDGGPS